jgi:transcriptional regulator with XRE-family HTH domain
MKMTEQRVAELVGLTFQQVQKYEKGINRISASRLQHLSQIFQVPVPFFFCRRAGYDHQRPRTDF